jgi:2-polyprenyl-6-methoxyphenol hydroxylase-like FAD-dependent oxidoreductase
MRILVVGAGVAGLTLAALLRQRGRDVEILDSEAARQPDHMMILTPLGIRVLHGLGILRRFRAMSPRLDLLRISNSKGKAAQELDLRTLSDDDEACRIVSHDALVHMLRGLILDAPTRATEIEGLTDEGPKVAVRTSDGVTERYDLVVGAEGTHSAVREKTGIIQETNDTGWGCWTFPVESAEPGRAIEYWGAGKMLMLVSGAWQMSGMACAPARDIQGTRHRKDHVQHLFRNFDRNAKDAIADFPNDDIPLAYRPIADFSAREWVKGRICLLGDAACALFPTSPLSASLAMESASVLAEELSRAGSRTVGAALDFYERRRRPRVEYVQSLARKASRRTFMPALLTVMRDTRQCLVEYQTLSALMKEPI